MCKLLKKYSKNLSLSPPGKVPVAGQDVASKGDLEIKEILVLHYPSLSFSESTCSVEMKIPVKGHDMEYKKGKCVSELRAPFLLSL